jgi:succinylglutamic semialdehyde dehydrogenase
MQKLISYNPTNNQVIWEGEACDAKMVDDAVQNARSAFTDWCLTSLEYRLEIMQNYVNILQENRPKITELIATENGKVVREANAEAGALISKVAISIEAYHKRTGLEQSEMEGGVKRLLIHRPHGIMAVFSPYNFPMHLANGHIVPSLIAGNVVLLKPSEETPACGELLVSLLHQAGVPTNVMQLLQGGRETGVALANHADIDGVLFTGSYATGQKIHQALSGKPDKMLALEMGGNNPLIVTNVADNAAAVSLIIDSAFASTGQRCTCARRLIMVDNPSNRQILEELLATLPKISSGAPFEQPEPYMGCMINNMQADLVLQGQAMLQAKGGKILHEIKRLHQGLPFINAGVIETTNADRSDDLEIFGALLQIIWVKDLQEAVSVANQTRYGLSAGLVSDNTSDWDYVYPRLRAGLVNFNRPLTGAASVAPFGGIGVSGNHRPTAYYAADYAAYPVASLKSSKVQKLELVGVGE